MRPISWTAIVGFVLALFPANLTAATLKLAWTPSPAATGYVVFLGTSSGDYTQQVSVGDVTQVPVSGLLDGVTYYFAVKAVGSNGLESELSAEISGTTPLRPAAPYLGFAWDGTPSVLWQHANGSLASWFLSGVAATGGTLLTPGAVLDPNWKIVGSADFNNDGAPDIVFQHSVTGVLFLWHMVGTSMSSPAAFSPAGPLDPIWRVVALADFNMDGRPDLLLQNGLSGTLVVWYMDGTSLIGSSLVNPTGPNDPRWKVVAARDLNGDTRPDLLFQHAVTGSLFVWFMDNAQLTGTGFTSPAGPNDAGWKVVGISDLNDDGWRDLVLQHSASGQILVWYLANLTVTSGALFAPASPGDPNWKVVSVE